MIKKQQRYAIIGQQCAGKTSLANRIAETSRYPRVIKFADPIYAMIACLGQSKHRGIMQDVGELAKRHFGEMVFVDLFKRAVRDDRVRSRSELLICDDVRRDYEAEACRELGFCIVYLHADEDVRRRRAEKQGLDFIATHVSETQVESLKGYADMLFFNNDGADIEEIAYHVCAPA